MTFWITNMKQAIETSWLTTVRFWGSIVNFSYTITSMSKPLPITSINIAMIMQITALYGWTLLVSKCIWLVEFILVMFSYWELSSFMIESRIWPSNSKWQNTKSLPTSKPSQNGFFANEIPSHIGIVFGSKYQILWFFFCCLESSFKCVII